MELIRRIVGMGFIVLLQLLLVCIYISVVSDYTNAIYSKGQHAFHIKIHGSINRRRSEAKYNLLINGTMSKFNLC